MPRGLRVLLIILGVALLVIAGFYYFRSERSSNSPTTASGSAESLHKSVWKDSSGNVYLAFDSNGQMTAPGSVGSQPDLTAVPTDVAIPVAPQNGLTRQVFQLERQKSVTVAVSSGRTQDFLVGETHLGKSQLEVARTLCQLLRDNEIDAIFVEQPDDLRYDWTRFESLGQRHDAVLAALQYRMVQDAHADLAPFLPYVKDAESDDEAISKIRAQFGPSGVTQFQAAMETEERYENSKYVSAVDYIYVAVHLEGLSIPFHNLESRTLRDKFNADAKNASSIEELRPDIAARDDYMVQSGRHLINNYGYHKIIWIIGAEHLKNLESRLSGSGDTVEIAFNSLASSSNQPNIKKEMISLVNPDELIKFANAPTPVDFQLSQDFSLPPGPSQQLSTAVTSALAQGDLDLKDPERIVAQNSFAHQYEAQKLRSQGSWSIKVAIGEGGTVEITKAQGGSVQVIRQSPVRVRNEGELTKLVPGFSVIDSDVGSRLSRVNKEQHYVSLFTVRNQGTSYAVYANEQPFYEGDDVRELVRRLNEQLQSVQISAIYLDLDGFSAKDATGFETSCRIQQKVLNNDRTLRVMTRFAEAPFAPAQFDPSHQPQFTTVKEGPFAGFARMTMRFIVNLGQSLAHITVVVYAKTLELAEEFRSHLQTLLGGSSLSLADAITATRIELKKKHQVSDDDLSDQFRIEVGGTLVVEASVERAVAV